MDAGTSSSAAASARGEAGGGDSSHPPSQRRVDWDEGLAGTDLRDARVRRFFGRVRGVGEAVDGDELPVVLAPMAHAGHLPLRLLALNHGAAAVFSEELVALRLRHVTREDNVELGTIDYYAAGSREALPALVYRTCAMERGRNVLQLGAAGAVEAVEAALEFARDVAGVDINMGCPESSSMSGGMGSALLARPDVACEILSSLRRALPEDMTVTCKIRLMEDARRSVDVVRKFEKAGASAVIVHARRVDQRPREPARWSELAPIVQAATVPIVANGDVFSFEDAVRLARMTGAASCMAARGAIGDPAAPFARRRLRDTHSSVLSYRSARHVADEYLAASELCDNALPVDKWFLAQVPRYRREPESQVLGPALATAEDADAVLAAFGLPSRLGRAQCWAGVSGERTATQWRAAFSRALSVVAVFPTPAASPLLPPAKLLRECAPECGDDMRGCDSGWAR